MTNKPLLSKKIDINKITYTPLSKGKSGGKVMFLQYDGKPLTVQLPKMNIPFGASDYKGNKKFAITFSFDSNNENHMETLKIFQALDEKLIKDGAKNSKEWFDSNRTIDGVRDSFQSQVKLSTDNQFPSKLKVSLQKDYNSNGFRFQLLDMNKNKLNVDANNISQITSKNGDTFNVLNDIPRNSEGVAIIECMGIWIVQKSLTLTWKLVKMKFETAQNTNMDFEEESDNEEIHSNFNEDHESSESEGQTEEEVEEEVAEEVEEEVEEEVAEEVEEKPVSKRVGKNAKTKKVLSLEK